MKTIIDQFVERVYEQVNNKHYGIETLAEGIESCRAEWNAAHPLVPNKEGWWWRDDSDEPFDVYVHPVSSELTYDVFKPKGLPQSVFNDGHWQGECLKGRVE